MATKSLNIKELVTSERSGLPQLICQLDGREVALPVGIIMAHLWHSLKKGRQPLPVIFQWLQTLELETLQLSDDMTCQIDAGTGFSLSFEEAILAAHFKSLPLILSESAHRQVLEMIKTPPPALPFTTTFAASVWQSFE